MSAQFHVDLGPFSFSVCTDSSGVTVQRGGLQKSFSWDSMTGALLVRPEAGELHREDEQLARAEKLLGTVVDFEKVKSIHHSMATVHIAYRDEHKRLKHEQIPIPLGDADFLREFQSQLGQRWLGEAPDQDAAEKKLHTAPGFFKTMFYLLVILVVIGLIGVFGIYSLAAPALNLLSLRQMYFDFQSGDFTAFGTHLFVYASLFVLAYVLRRLWKNRREARRGSSTPHSRSR